MKVFLGYFPYCQVNSKSSPNSSPTKFIIDFALSDIVTQLLGTGNLIETINWEKLNHRISEIKGTLWFNHLLYN